MDGNYGAVALALMTDLTTVPAAPTITLGVKQFADPQPKGTYTDEQIATGTKFGVDRVFQGWESGEKQIVARATMRDLPPILTALLGTPDGTTGLITPRSADYGALMPGQPVAVWQKHPLRNVLFKGAQISGVTINFQTRQTAEATVRIFTGSPEKLTTLPTLPAIASTGLVKFANLALTIDGKNYAPESGTLDISQPMQVEDGARGYDAAVRDYPLGVSTNGSLTASMSFSLSEVGAGAGVGPKKGDLIGLLDLATPDGTTGEVVKKVVEVSLEVGGKPIKFTFPSAEISADNIPNGLGRLVVGFKATGTGLGVPPLTVTITP